MNDIIINNSSVWITRNKAVKDRLQKKEKIDTRPTFYKMIKIGGWRFYITRNIRLKHRNKRDSYNTLFKRSDFRKHVYERSGHRCEICGNELTWKEMELHHVLPIGRFPQLTMDERNLQCLCHSCHKDIHCDPYKEIRQMEVKANELGINLKDYYDYGGASEG